MNTAQSDSLWQELIALYAEEGVAGACIEAQDDAGADVVLLLCAALLARRGQRLDDTLKGAMETVAGSWREDIVVPLRELRRAWRGYPGIDPLRRQLAGLEQEAERQQFYRLATMLEGPASETPPPDLLWQNLATVLGDADQCHALALAQLMGRGWQGTPEE